MARGEFREDLFFRLNVVHLHLPPLRERGEDMALLLKANLQRYAQRLGKDVIDDVDDEQVLDAGLIAAGQAAEH